DRNGLIVFVPTGAYDDSAGPVTLFDVIPTRAFIPWDDDLRSFRFDQPVIFPLATSLYDRKRLDAALIDGTMSESPIRVAATDRVLEGLSLTPTTSTTSNGTATITYRHLTIDDGAVLRVWVSLSPAYFGNASVGTNTVSVLVDTGTGNQTV